MVYRRKFVPGIKRDRAWQVRRPKRRVPQLLFAYPTVQPFPFVIVCSLRQGLRPECLACRAPHRMPFGICVEPLERRQRAMIIGAQPPIPLRKRSFAWFASMGGYIFGATPYIDNPMFSHLQKGFAADSCEAPQYRLIPVWQGVHRIEPKSFTSPFMPEATPDPFAWWASWQLADINCGQCLSVALIQIEASRPYQLFTCIARNARIRTWGRSSLNAIRRSNCPRGSPAPGCSPAIRSQAITNHNRAASQ